MKKNTISAISYPIFGPWCVLDIIMILEVLGIITYIYEAKSH